MENITLIKKARELAKADYKQGAGYTTTLNALCDALEADPLYIQQFGRVTRNKPSFKRGDILLSKVDVGLEVEFYEWADETKTAFHGWASVAGVKHGWSNSWNGSCFEHVTEAPMQTHLVPSQVQEAVANYVSAKFNKKAYNIKVDDLGATYEC